MLPTGSTSQRCLIPIHIETLVGTSFELLVTPHEQIQNIKRKIERREGIPATQQRLIWKTTELEDESCLNDYNIDAGTTLKLILAMRGGPVNTRRVPIEDTIIRDMSEYIENGRDDYGVGSDLMPSANKNVTFLVLRDGDQFNFFQVIDRGDGTVSPLSGSISSTSMYNTQETLAVEPDRESDEKRQADDMKTKQKMELIRSKLKTHTRKNILISPRPSSSSKQSKSNLVHHHRRIVRIDTDSNISTNGDASSGTSSLEQQYRPVSYSYATTNLFNNYNLLAASVAHQHDLLHEEDSEDDEEDDDDSHDDDDDDEDEEIKSKPVFTSRSFSPSMFYHNMPSHHEQIFQKPLATTTTPETDLNSKTGSIDLLPHPSLVDKPVNNLEQSSTMNLISPECALPTVSSVDQHQIESHDLSTNGVLPNDEKNDVEQKSSIESQNRNECVPNKTQRTDSGTEQVKNTSGEYSSIERTPTSQSIRFRHQLSSTITPLPSLSSMTKRSTLPASTQQFSHHYKSTINEQQSPRPSPRPLVPLSLSKYRRIPSNLQLSNTVKKPMLIGATSNPANIENNSAATSFNEHSMCNKRLETLKTPAKQKIPQSTAPSPASSSSMSILPTPALSKRPVPQPPPTLPTQDIKSTNTTATIPSTPPPTLLPMDSTKVTIETIGPKTVSALLRQNATIEPVDTSRGVGKHLVSLLTTASKETSSLKIAHNKQLTHDVVVEERFKLDSKTNNNNNNTWSTLLTNNPSTVSSSFQSNAATIYNPNKLPPVVVNRKSTSKCFLCKKKTGLATTYQCRCGSSFCSEHRYPEAHACAFDYKAEGKRLIERNNPLVSAPKLPKI